MRENGVENKRMQVVPYPLSNRGDDRPTEDPEAVVLARIYELILSWPQAADTESDQSQETAEAQEGNAKH